MNQEKKFPLRIFFLFLGILFLLVGIHTAFLMLIFALDMPTWIQIAIPIMYLLSAASILTYFTRMTIQKEYEVPLKKFARATKDVSSGDFTVYLPTVHTPDQYDYLDYMILNFNQMVEELGSIETLKTDFISNVSHEMKTPLAIIQNYAQLMLGENITDEQRKEYAETIIETSKKMTELISNILRLNKLENQTIQPQFTKFDLVRQLTDSILQYDTKLEEKNIEIETNFDESCWILGDEELLEHVWNNILSNAVKFTPADGLIIFDLQETDKEITVSIKDNGCGMDEETTAHIFDKFYQGDTSHATQGNGLGLALSKRIVEIMDGTIQAESKINEGSNFIVTLPKHREDYDNDSI